MRAGSALVAISLIAHGASWAQSSGTISGTVQATDGRLNPYFAAGYTAASPAGARQSHGFSGIRDLQDATVKLYIYQTTSIYDVRYTRLSPTGTYSIPWSTTYTPIKIKVAIAASRPDIGAGVVTASSPSYQFAVDGPAGTIVQSITRSTAFVGNLTVNFTIPASGAIDTYLTAHEVFAMWDAMGNPTTGGSIRSDMTGLVITRDSAIIGGVTPDPHSILVNPSIPTSLPDVVAHEMGHALVWASLDVPAAVVGPPDYLCIFPGKDDSNPSWDDFSYECEKVAFQEGFAIAHTGLWMWLRNSSNRNIRGGSSFYGLEGAGTCNSGADEDNRPGCNARGIWDIIDNSPSDGDGITNRDLSDIVSAFRGFQDYCPACLDNHCAYEGWPWDSLICLGDVDANNWKDFKYNFSLLFGQSTELNGIEGNNGLAAQSND